MTLTFDSIVNFQHIIVSTTHPLQTQRLHCQVIEGSRLGVCEHPDPAPGPGLGEGRVPLLSPELLPILVHGDGEAVEAGPVPDQRPYDI